MVAPHAGFDDGYREVDEAVARAWGYGGSRLTTKGGTNALTLFEPFVAAAAKAPTR